MNFETWAPVMIIGLTVCAVALVFVLNNQQRINQITLRRINRLEQRAE